MLLLDKHKRHLSTTGSWRMRTRYLSSKIAQCLRKIVVHLQAVNTYGQGLKVNTYGQGLKVNTYGQGLKVNTYGQEVKQRST